jgi:hypothetical protein
MNTLFEINLRQFSPGRRVLVLIFVCILAVGSSLAQKKPTALKLDADADDKSLCEGALKESQFCEYHKTYNRPSSTEAQKRSARNEMIQLVRGQVDTYYKLRKDGRKTKIRWLQTLLDFLEIGAATSIAIMNGERARGVVGSALTGFQGGRTAFNKNFEILQTQVLINTMNTNRANIFAEIVTSSARPSSDYTWYAAKNDLRRYLFAGTFNNALDTLVDQTGANVERAERNLRAVGEISAGDLRVARNAQQSLVLLREALTSAATRDKATETLRAILVVLNDNLEVRSALAAESISAASDGAAIRAGLILARGKLLQAGKDNLVTLINQTIVDITAEKMP